MIPNAFALGLEDCRVSVWPPSHTGFLKLWMCPPAPSSLWNDTAQVYDFASLPKHLNRSIDYAEEWFIPPMMVKQDLPSPEKSYYSEQSLWWNKELHTHLAPTLPCRAIAHVWELEKKAVKKCKCRSACFAPHTQTLRVNKQPSPGTVFKSNRDKQILSISVLEPHKTYSLQNTFTLLLPEANFPLTWENGEERKM